MALSAKRDLLMLLVRRELAGRYKATVLGQLWSLINPLATILLYSVVFGLVFRISPPSGEPSGLNSFALYLVSGLVPWLFFANVLNQASQAVVTQAGLINKVHFPRIFLPLAVSIAAAISWSIEMGVVALVLTVAGSNVLALVLPLLGAMALLAIFASAIGIISSVITVYFRDFSYLLAIFLQFGFFTAPILYPKQFVQELSADTGSLLGTHITVADLYDSNPLVGFVDVFHSLLYDGTLPESAAVIQVAAWSGAVALLAIVLFRRTEKRLAEIL